MKPETRRVLDVLPATRTALRLRLRVDDRQARRLIQLAREDGYPILSPDNKSDMYRLAETDEEIDKIYDDLQSRGLSLFTTAARMRTRYKCKGQMTIE